MDPTAIAQQPKTAAELRAIEAAKLRFHGNPTLKSKYAPKIPKGTDREYYRIVNSYMGILKDELQKELPNIRVEYEKQRKDDAAESRNDSADELWMAIGIIFSRMQNNITKRIEGYDLRKKLDKLSILARRITLEEWKKAVHQTLGIDLKEDYYLGDFFKDGMSQWASDNVDLIKTIPYDTLGEMRAIVEDGYNTGRNTKDITQSIADKYGTSLVHARLIARDQCAKLNARICQEQQKYAGIDSYTWSTCKDEAVRPGHAIMDGKTYRWDDPPEIMQWSDKYGWVSTGRKCHPGEDYQCRCIADPIFAEINIGSLPVDTGEEA